VINVDAKCSNFCPGPLEKKIMKEMVACIVYCKMNAITSGNQGNIK